MRKIKHKGLHADRLTDPLHSQERVFAEEWGAVQTGDVPILAAMLHSDGSVASIRTDRLTQREAEIAATVAQWLGSNVGWNFLEKCLDRCGYMLLRKSLSPLAGDTASLGLPIGRTSPPLTASGGRVTVTGSGYDPKHPVIPPDGNMGAFCPGCAQEGETEETIRHGAGCDRTTPAGYVQLRSRPLWRCSSCGATGNATAEIQHSPDCNRFKVLARNSAAGKKEAR